MMSRMATGQSDCCLFISSIRGNVLQRGKIPFAVMHDLLIFTRLQIADVSTDAVRVVVVALDGAGRFTTLGVAAKQPNVGNVDAAVVNCVGDFGLPIDAERVNLGFKSVHGGSREGRLTPPPLWRGSKTLRG